MRYLPLAASEFIQRRQQLQIAIPQGEEIVRSSGALITRSNDTDYVFRPESNFFYLTGIDEPGAVLVLSKQSERLLLPKTDEHDQLWVGEGIGLEQASLISGIQHVDWRDDEEYTKHLPNQIMEQIHRQRMIKSLAEVEQIKQAIAITAAGFERLRQRLAPDVFEYELEAELTYEFIRHGSTGHAYDPIIAGGGRATVLHYIRNDQRLKSGELVLIDAGAESGYYASDISRTYAVGQISARQSDVISAVNDVKAEAISLLRPGLSWREFETEVGELMTEQLCQLGILKPGATKTAYREFYPHATSHFVGLDVHDVGDYSQPLAAGMVITVEPGIYIKEEGIGVRAEDDILITADGCTNLSDMVE